MCGGGFVIVAAEIQTSAFGHGTVTWRDEVWQLSRGRHGWKRFFLAKINFWVRMFHVKTQRLRTAIKIKWKNYVL